MIKVCGALAVLATMLPGCIRPAASWKGEVKWPESEQDEQSVKLIVPAIEAEAAIAAAAAIREMVRTNPFPRLFQGCSTPAKGMDVAVFTGPTPGVYYVALGQHFDRCGGPVGRMLDWHYVYAVTPQGEVVGEAPPPRAEPLPAEPEPYRPSSPSPEPTQPPAAPPDNTGAGTPPPTPPPAASPPPSPTAPPPAAPSPTPSPTHSEPGTPG
jgi:hypothetical protein